MTGENEVVHDDERADPEPRIAYVYGDDVPPDFAALAACGFTSVCLDKTAPWYRDGMLEEARAAGLTVVAFAMRYVGREPAARRETKPLRRRTTQ